MTELGDQILQLRSEGLTYNQIKDKLNCSKSTISYYCSEQGKEKTKERTDKYKESNEYWKFIKAVGWFKTDRYKYRAGEKLKKAIDWNHKFRSACSRYRLRNKNKEHNMENTDYTYKDAIDHLGGTITKCYLTGREIDITKDDFNLDHIIPASKGGTCELNNMGITIPEANSMKSNLLKEDLFDLCKEILEYNGYEVKKLE